MSKLKVFVLLFGFLISVPGIPADPISAETIIEQVMPSIVAIRADTPEGKAAGTGFLVDSTGVVVTNLHVIEGATRVAIKLHSGEQYTQIRVASFDQERDLAILRIPGFDLPVVNLGNSDDVKVGATVYAIGNPLGLEESVTKGIVSSIRAIEGGTKIIQTDSAVSPGNSGGPLINDHGDVVGIVTYKLSAGENLNFAVPINYVRALLPFEQLRSLDELSQELGRAKVSLFAERDDNSLTGNWLSLSSNAVGLLRLDGDYLHGTISVGKFAGAYDLSKQDDGTYAGVVNSREDLWYRESGNSQKIDIVCRFSYKTELLKVTNRRIEGRIQVYRWPESDRARLEFAKSCGTAKTYDLVWEDFVWVRTD